jgi:hypothetical protein
MNNKKRKPQGFFLKMKSMLSLFHIGNGCLILPFFDGEEAKHLCVNREMLHMIQSFDFQVPRDNMFFANGWRHHGSTYQREDNHVFQDNKLIGLYMEQIDIIVNHSQRFEFFEDDLCHVITINNVTYLMEIGGITLWLYCENRKLEGPYYMINQCTDVIRVEDEIIPSIDTSDALELRARFIQVIHDLERVWKENPVYDICHGKMKNILNAIPHKDDYYYYKTLFGILIDYDNQYAILPNISDLIQDHIMHYIQHIYDDAY